MLTIQSSLAAGALAYVNLNLDIQEIFKNLPRSRPWYASTYGSAEACRLERGHALSSREPEFDSDDCSTGKADHH